MTTAKDVMKQIKDNDVKFVDLRFTDPKGKLHHVTMDIAEVEEEMFADGVMFDGSSIAGWKAINESDMVLMPDIDTIHMDPFFAQSTMVILCDILDPVSGEAYNRDPRGTAKKAEAYLKAEGIGDTIFVGPEAEFCNVARSRRPTSSLPCPVDTNCTGHRGSKASVPMPSAAATSAANAVGRGGWNIGGFCSMAMW